MDDDKDIGARARMIRRRRGLSLAAAAGLTGISESYLSRLESGQRSFVRRGLIEDLADALGCSPIDLTGLPAIGPDRRAAIAAGAIPAVAVALHDNTLDDVCDLPTRPVHVLVEVAARANALADEVEYLPGTQLGDLLSELHVAAATTTGDDQRAALAALVEACIVARSLAGTMGHDELAVTATRRGWDAARKLERPDLIALLAMGRGLTLNRIGARRRATTIVDRALADIAAEPGPTEQHTATAESHGMLHLAAAHLAARDGRADDADTHLDEAATLARHTGERNHMRYHFGPQNVAAWTLAVAVETGRGPDAAERLDAQPIDVAALGSADRVAAVHFDMARAFAQADGPRDAASLRHLDLADRAAPLRIRRDPVVRELVQDLDRRARRQVWELGSLKRRVGV
jgi:transcriptional regulator with XRE-family HTH domain